MTLDLRAKILEAVNLKGGASSDFDLDSGLILPKSRDLRPAAVLIPLVVRSTTSTLLLTKRSSALKHHPGQIAFPGGKADQNDSSVIGTALREAREEIGLQSSDVEVLGTLPPHETVTGFSATPVVALVKDVEFYPTPEAGEVEEAFEVPLDHLLNLENYSIQSRRWHNQKRSYYSVPWGPYYIWGATARMLRSFAERMANAGR